MPPKPGTKADIERGKRLKKWLAKVAPDVKASYRGMVVLEEPRQTVTNWINGSKISTAGICKIIEVGGYEALSYILDAKPYVSNAKNAHVPDGPLVHNKGARFWYNQYVREKARTVLNEKQDYTAFPEHARHALGRADDFARKKASEARATGSKKPRGKDYDFL